MKKLSIGLLVVLMSSFITTVGQQVSAQVGVLGYEIQCGEQMIIGSIQTSYPDQTVLDVIIQGEGDASSSILGVVAVSGEDMYDVTIDPVGYSEGWYDIILEASLQDQAVQKRYAVYFKDGTCDTAQSIQKRIDGYAQEAKEIFENNEKVQDVPSSFLKTGIRDRVQNAIETTAETFALSSSPVYHDTPGWTTDPDALTYLTFEQQYAYIPEQYRGASAYLKFKGLLVPINTPVGEISEEQLLEMLNTGALLAPETPSLDTLGAVKMIYTHSMSLTDSPFAGVGSYLSVFADAGDEFDVYIKQGYVSYEKRTYVMTHRLQIQPQQTDIIKNYKKEGADTIAMITCKDGDVLGSTNGREVLFLERKNDELSEFQSALIMINSIPQLSIQRDEFDRYMTTPPPSSEELIKIVKRLEIVEEETAASADTNEDDAIKNLMATYAKYKLAYNALEEAE